VLTLELEPPQPEISSNAGAANDPQQTRAHFHETSKNTFFHQNPHFALYLRCRSSFSHSFVSLSKIAWWPIMSPRTNRSATGAVDISSLRTAARY
jgi:hypothetical protein